MLVNSDGYSFNVKRENKSKKFIYWTCSVRTKPHHCPAWVKQTGEMYQTSDIGHNHPPDPTKRNRLKAAVMVKDKAATEIFRPSGQIVREALREMEQLTENTRAKPANLQRAVNRHRQALRPEDPKLDNLDFELDKNFIETETFLLEDIRTTVARHLMFGSPDQLQHLARARRWFIDGIFKVVRKPFYQLLSIHAFVRKDDAVKQVPLLFVLMSRRKKRDYIAVFQALLDILAPDVPNLEWFMLDYEAAAWQAVRHIFQCAILHGCVFRWTQRVYRKVMRLGLSASYTDGCDVQ